MAWCEIQEHLQMPALTCMQDCGKKMTAQSCTKHNRNNSDAAHCLFATFATCTFHPGQPCVLRFVAFRSLKACRLPGVEIYTSKDTVPVINMVNG